MTPRRLDPGVVQRKLTLMDELLQDLDQFRAVDGATLRADRVTRHAVERVLTQLVQLAVDINAHLVAGMGRPSPADYRGSFDSAIEAGVLPAELAARLRPSVGLRNLLIHEYAAIDLDLVAAACGRASTDYRDYVRTVARRPGPPPFCRSRRPLKTPV